MKTNKIIIDEINTDKFAEKYDFFRIISSYKNKKGIACIPYNAYALSFNEETKRIKSLCYENINSLLVMIKRPEEREISSNTLLLKIKKKDQEENDFLSIEKLNPNKIKPYHFLRLLINSLAEEPFEEDEGTGALMTGHYYQINDSWGKNKGSPNSFVAMRADIDPQCRFNITMHTFQIVTSKNKEEEEKIIVSKNKNRRQLYILNKQNGVIRRKRKGMRAGKNEILCYLHGEPGHHAAKELLNIGAKEESDLFKGRAAAESIVFQKLKQKYGDTNMLKFHLDEVPDEIIQKIKVKESEIQVQKLQKKKEIGFIPKIIIVNESGVRGMEDILFKRCQEEGEYFKSIEIGKEIPNNSKEYFLSIIHNKSFYKDKKDITDPHSFSSGQIIQHITVETIQDNEARIEHSKAEKLEPLIHQLYHPLFRTCAYNIQIKQDIKNQKLTLPTNFRKEDPFITKDMIFISTIPLPKNNTDHERYAAKMTIHPNGTFKIELLTRPAKLDQFKDNKLNDIFDALYKPNEDGIGNTECLVRSEEGNWAKIYDTGTHTVGDLKAIQKFMIQKKETGNKKGLRSKEIRDKYLTPYIGTHYWTDGKDYFYYVGSYENGAGRKVQNYLHIRKVTSLSSDETVVTDDFFRKICPDPYDIFIRNGQKSVLPFPVKYCSEFLKMSLPDVFSNNISDDSDNDEDEDEDNLE